MTKTTLIKSMLATALCSVCAFAAQAGDTLRVATNAVYPPFEFHQNGEVTGFEIDLIKAMAKQMGKEIELIDMKFDGILPAVLTNTIDVGASGFSVTEERAKKVAFVDPFYTSGLTILVPQGSTIKNFKDLEGKKISVQLGTTSQQLAKSIKDTKVTTFDSPSDAVLNMLGGQADAVINDKPVTDYMLTQNRDFAKKLVHLPEVATADQFAMIANKKNTELVQALNAALAELKKNGTYDRLHVKWFGKKAAE